MLRSDVPAVPFALIRGAIEQELGRPIEQVFRALDPHPLAAASIAQVHVGELLDGTRVAVKVRRPGINQVMEQDLGILVWLAAKADRWLAAARAFHPRQAALEIQRYTRRELDFRSEAKVAERLALQFATWPDVVVPKIYYRAPGCLVMDYVPGFPIDDLASIHANGLEPRALVRTTVNCMLEQILAAGVFHADPHPGNLHITPDGKLALLDFGIYGELDPQTRRNAALSFLMQAHGEYELAAAYLLKVAEPDPDADLTSYRHAVVEMYRAWASSSLAEYGFGQLVYDVVMEAAKHGASYPSGVLLYAKAMLTLEGVALSVAPETNMQREAAPFLERLAERLLNRRHVIDAIEQAWPLWMDLAERLPVGGAWWVERRMKAPPPGTRRHHPQPPRDWLPAVPMAGGIALLVAQVGPAWHGISGLGALVLALGWLWGRRSPP